jgi:hypothetical protein
LKNSAAEWMEKNWPSDVEFTGLDDENLNPPYTVRLLKNIDILDLPVYSFKHDVTIAMHVYSKCYPCLMV